MEEPFFRLLADPENLPGERLRKAHEYWLGIHNEKGLPCRELLDPTQIIELLPWTIIVDIHEGSDAVELFEIRLFGTGIVERFGRDLTGLVFGEAFPETFRGHFFGAYACLYDAARPVLTHWQQPQEGREHVTYYALLCPLYDTDDRLSQSYTTLWFE